MSVSATHRLIERAAKDVGVPLPATLTAKITEATTLLARAQAFRDERSHSELIDTVATELTSGADPLDSAAVQRAALAAQLGKAGVPGSVGVMTDRMVTSALVDAADEILSSWATALTPHADNLMAAAEELDTDDLHHLPAIQRAPVAYSLACEALLRFDAAMTGVRLLTGLAGIGVHLRTLYLLNDPARLAELQQAAAKREEHHPSPWLMARHGCRPTLADSVATLMERVAAQRQLAQAAESARQSSKAQTRDPLSA